MTNNRKGCPKGSSKIQGRCRTEKILCYHGRCGQFCLNQDENGPFIMVRVSPAGTGRLHLVNGNVPKSMRDWNYKTDTKRKIKFVYGYSKKKLQEFKKKFSYMKNWKIIKEGANYLLLPAGKKTRKALAKQKANWYKKKITTELGDMGLLK